MIQAVQSEQSVCSFTHMHLQTGNLAFALPWIEEGWIKVVTGRGYGHNYASCMANLAVLNRELHVVASLLQ